MKTGNFPWPGNFSGAKKFATGYLPPVILSGDQDAGVPSQIHNVHRISSRNRNLITKIPDMWVQFHIWFLIPRLKENFSFIDRVSRPGGPASGVHRLSVWHRCGRYRHALLQCARQNSESR